MYSNKTRLSKKNTHTHTKANIFDGIFAAGKGEQSWMNVHPERKQDSSSVYNDGALIMDNMKTYMSTSLCTQAEDSHLGSDKPGHQILAGMYANHINTL